MNIAELNALTSASAVPTEDTDLGGGLILPQHAAGIRNYVRYIVRPYKSVREQFLTPMRMIKAGGEDAAVASIDWEGQATLGIEDRIEADTTFVALTLCRPKNRQELLPFEAWVTNSLSDDQFAKALEGAKRVTYGGDVKGFFGRVSEQVSGMNIMTLLTPSLPTDETTDAAA